MNIANAGQRVPTPRDRLVVYFHFCISQRGGIGPLVLKKLWKAVSCCGHVRVSRAPRSNSDGFIYSLAAPSGLENLASMEAELRLLLAKHVLGEVTLLARIAG